MTQADDQKPDNQATTDQDQTAKEWTVDEAEPNLRLDRFVSESLGVSRKQAVHLIEQGRVTVNDGPQRKGKNLRPGDLVRVGGPKPQADWEPIGSSSSEIQVLHEDEQLVVCQKPAGIHCVPLEPSEAGTLAGFLARRYPEAVAVGRWRREAGLLHRIDRDTSGIVCSARTKAAFNSLLEQFAKRSIEKKYLALVSGNPPRRGVVDRPIRRKGRSSNRVQILAEGDRRRGREIQEALTRYKVKENLAGAALLEVDMVTGAMHQIRAHLSFIGHPIIGDSLYGFGGAGGASRQLLHAWKLKLIHPATGRPVQFVSAIPEDFRLALERFRQV